MHHRLPSTIALLTVVALIFNAQLASAATATQLAITDINAGVPPTTFAPFSVTVQSQDSNGNPANVVADTTVFLTDGFNSVFNPLGQVEGTIKAGTHSVTISNVSHNYSGLLIVAVAGSGDPLASSQFKFISLYGSKATELSLFLDTSFSQPTSLSPFYVIINIRDAVGNLARVTQDTTVMLYLSSGSGKLSGNVTTVIPAGSDFGQFYVSYSKAEAGVVLAAIAISGDSLTEGIITPFNVAGPATNLSVAFAPVGNVVPTEGTTSAPFQMIVSATDGAGVQMPVTSDTAFVLTRGQGTGHLGGEVTGTILAGTATAIVAVTYDVAESNVTLVATETAGDNLAPFTTAPFAVVTPTPIVPTQLTVYANSVFYLTANIPFNVIVETITTDGNYAPVATDTAIHLSVTSGTGQLMGILDGTIPAREQTMPVFQLRIQYPKVTLSFPRGSCKRRCSRARKYVADHLHWLR